jgi:hypothetical protein
VLQAEVTGSKPHIDDCEIEQSWFSLTTFATSSITHPLATANSTALTSYSCTSTNGFTRIPMSGSRYNVPMLCFVVLLILVCCQARATVSYPLAFRAGSNADSSPEGPLVLLLNTIKEARRHLAAAAVARSVSIFSMYPVDTIKTRIQMGQASALRLSGLYNGLAGSLLGQVPYG